MAKGFAQRRGVDYSEIYAPVAKHSTLRAVLAYAAEHSLELHQADIKTAFLNGNLEETVYMQQPPGYEDGVPGKVCLLHRSLYGLKQSPRAWYSKLKTVLQGYRFMASTSDASLYVREDVTGLSILLVYVDDILIACKKGQLEGIMGMFANEFDI